MVAELQNYLNKILPAPAYRQAGAVATSETSEVAKALGAWPLEATAPACRQGRDERFGDYSSNVAFRLAKVVGKTPLNVAQNLARQIMAADIDGVFEKVEAVAPGFLNFTLSPTFVAENLQALLKSKKLSPRKLLSKSSKINLEFISANPTGPLTMANGRGGFLGDVLANVLEAVGDKVSREYYVNDAGGQIKKLGESVMAALGLVAPSEEHYQGGYIKELAGKYEVKIKKKLAEAGGQSVAASGEAVGQLVAEDLLDQIKTSVKNVGIGFDEWFSEHKELRQKKALEKVLALLEKRGMVYKKDGATWLARQVTCDARRVTGEKQPVTCDVRHATCDRLIEGGERENQDWVLIKSDGEPTYLLADLAYHYNKLVERGFDRAIDIWGADHHGYVVRLKTGLAALGIDPERLQIIIIQLVRLVRGGKEERMSKRRGEFVTLDDLVTEAGADAARFFFLMYSPDTHMDFDLDLAKERSAKNPVYYAQYAYVRAKSVLEKAKATTGLWPKNFSMDFNLDLGDQWSDEDLRLAKELVKLPDVIAAIATDFQVTRLTRYAADLARAFHNFYEKERVISDDVARTSRRLQLVAAVKEIFERLFKILGISAPEKM